MTILCESGLSTFGQGDTHLERSCPQGYQIIATSFQLEGKKGREGRTRIREGNGGRWGRRLVSQDVSDKLTIDMSSSG